MEHTERKQILLPETLRALPLRFGLYVITRLNLAATHFDLKWLWRIEPHFVASDRLDGEVPRSCERIANREHRKVSFEFLSSITCGEGFICDSIISSEYDWRVIGEYLVRLSTWYWRWKTETWSPTFQLEIRWKLPFLDAYWLLLVIPNKLDAGPRNFSFKFEPLLPLHT